MNSRPSSVSKLRSTIQDAVVSGHQTVLRQSVLRGAFASSFTVSQWKCPTFKLIVFVSSTFTDTILKCNYLLDELLVDERKEGVET